MEYKEFIFLVEELKKGADKRLKSIFKENSSYCINKLVSKFGCSREDAEDIYIDSILNFREKILSGRIEALTDVRAYLYSTCKNMLLVKLKKEKRILAAVTETFEPVTESTIFENENVVYKEEISKATEKALSNLPLKCQELLKLFYFDQLSLDEISNKMNFANANVAKVSKCRCFQKLIDQIKIVQGQKTRLQNVK